LGGRHGHHHHRRQRAVAAPMMQSCGRLGSAFGCNSLECERLKHMK
jgi:hypothetical protein